MKYLSSEYKAYINPVGWKKSLRRRIALRLLFGRDPIIPLLAATEVEHLSYLRINFKQCKGYEIPFLDIIGMNRVTHRNIVTPVKNLLRKLFGRRLGNAIVANFLRGCLLFWYVVLLSPVLFVAIKKP